MLLPSLNVTIVTSNVIIKVVLNTPQKQPMTNFSVITTILILISISITVTKKYIAFIQVERLNILPRNIPPCKFSVQYQYSLVYLASHINLSDKELCLFFRVFQKWEHLALLAQAQLNSGGGAKFTMVLEEHHLAVQTTHIIYVPIFHVFACARFTIVVTKILLSMQL